MAVRFYMDQHVSARITEGLRRRGVDVLTAYEDGSSRLPDPALMDRASELGRVMVSQDADMLAEAARRQEFGIPFSGVIYAHQMRVPVGRAVVDLDKTAREGDAEELAGTVLYLPLKS